MQRTDTKAQLEEQQRIHMERQMEQKESSWSSRWTSSASNWHSKRS